MDVSKNRDFCPPNHPFVQGFPLFSPSILGYPNFWKHPHILLSLSTETVLPKNTMGQWDLWKDPVMMFFMHVESSKKI